MRLVSHNDAPGSEEVRSGTRELNATAGVVEFVRDRIADAMARPPVELQCPQCRSRHVRECSVRAARGYATWKHCQDCGLVFELGFDT